MVRTAALWRFVPIFADMSALTVVNYGASAAVVTTTAPDPRWVGAINDSSKAREQGGRLWWVVCGVKNQVGQCGGL
jgi:hypothetical protein